MKQVEPGFSLVELLVVLVIIGILLAMLFPVLSQVRKTSMGMQCQSNLRYMQGGWHIAISQNGDIIPWTRYTGRHPNWKDLLTGVLAEGPGISETSVCPLAQRNYGSTVYSHGSWGYVANTRWERGMPNEPSTQALPLHEQPPWLNQGKRWSDIRRPSRYPWFMDVEIYPLSEMHNVAHRFAPAEAPILENWGVGSHHNDGTAVNVSFADGSVRMVSLTTIKEETAGNGSFGWFENR